MAMAVAMKVLDVPLHSLASNCISFGLFTLVNNFWTLVAVVTTAALSFWSIRFRASSSSSSSSSRAVISPPKLDPPPHLHDPEPPEASPSPSTDVPAPSSSTLPAVACGGDSVTKGRFSVYYENRHPVWESDGEVEVAGPGAAAGKNHWSDLEGVMKTRMGELGWYRFQDRTVMNGSVVRLWSLQGRRRCDISFPGGIISTSVVDS